MAKRGRPKNKELQKGNMIHIRVLPEVHRRLRLRAAEKDITMQEFVAKVLAKEVMRGEGA